MIADPSECDSIMILISIITGWYIELLNQLYFHLSTRSESVH